MRVSGIPYVQGKNVYPDADGTKYAIAIHNTSNDASAEGEATYAKRRTDGISAHFYVDQDSVVQSIDTKDRTGHAGSNNGNQHAVSVEITGVNSWTRAKWISSVAWDSLGKVLAQVCKHYGIPLVRPSVAVMQSNPRVKGFYSHDDMRRAWGGTTHTDPGPNFPWDVLFLTVAKHMGMPVPGTPKPPAPKPPTDWTVSLIMALPNAKQGDKGETVGTVQALCTARGVSCKMDNDFGPATKAAVKSVQTKYGAESRDGIVGPETWTILITGKDSR